MDLKDRIHRVDLPFPVFSAEPLYRQICEAASPAPLCPLLITNSACTDEWLVNYHENSANGLPAELNCYFLSDALVFGNGIISLDNTIIKSPDLMPFYVCNGIDSKTIDVSFYEHLPMRVIDEPCIVYAGWGIAIYGHVLIEFLPKLRAIYRAEILGNKRPKLLVQSNIPIWHIEILDTLFGIKSADLVYFNPNQERILLRSAIAPGLVMQPDGFLPYMSEVIDWIKATCVKEQKQPLPRRIYLSRALFKESHTKHRKFENESNIAAIASIEFGFSVINPETLPWATQVALFAGAEAIVGEFGSGLHAAMFSPAETKVLSIGFGNAVQSHIGALCNHKNAYLRITGTLNDTFSADEELFRSMMAACFPPQGSGPFYDSTAPIATERAQHSGVPWPFYWPSVSSVMPPRPPTDVPPDFDPDGYLRLNADVLAAGVDPKAHYLRYGWHERRRWTDEI